MRTPITRLFVSFSLITLGWAADVLPRPQEAKGQEAKSKEPVVQLAPGFPIVPGSKSKLTRDPGSLELEIRSHGFTPGTVVTAWWLVFNHPEACANPIQRPDGIWLCSGPDVSNPATGATYQFLAGQVVGNDGKISLAGELKVGNTSGCAAPTLPCVGLLDSFGSEPHIPLRSMGPIIPSLLQEQLTTFNGGCLAGQPNAGQCVNVQGAVHFRVE
jgi:hypothetical protein